MKGGRSLYHDGGKEFISRRAEGGRQESVGRARIRDNVFAHAAGMATMGFVVSGFQAASARGRPARPHTHAASSVQLSQLLVRKNRLGVSTANLGRVDF